MGIMQAPEKCFITDQQTYNIVDDYDDIFYSVNYAGEKLTLAFYTDHKNSKFVEENKYILKGLILNKKFPVSKKRVIYDNESLESIIKQATYPKTPKEKIDNLIIYFHSLQGYEGQEIKLFKDLEKDILIYKLFFKNYDEFWFYLSTLESQRFVNYIDPIDFNGPKAMALKLTFSGLDYVLKLQEEGRYSKNCFVAMSFSNNTEKIRVGIKEAIAECGYNTIIVDEINIPSEITINDAIISNIKKCKFLIADFTENKHGVYFEAGFGLGRGIPVIYSCSKQDWDDVHFDTNHYPHIIYETPDELKKKLIERIEAWID